ANSHGDVWEFTQEMKNEHPAPFPVALIERLISSTNANLILDPFMGSGTTAIAAKKLGRSFVGIEISPEYIDLAKRRLQHFCPAEERSIEPSNPQKAYVTIS
ncbi:MAG: site-specific DNA-methyltransferase, partial [Verrucomicrobiota bacterium]